MLNGGDSLARIHFYALSRASAPKNSPKEAFIQHSKFSIQHLAFAFAS